MNSPRSLVRLFEVLLILLWALPGYRLVQFYQQSRRALKESESSKDGLDVDLALSLFQSYCFSVFAGFLVIWCFQNRRSRWFVVPFAALLYAVAEVIYLHPERTIVLIPVMDAHRPLWISLGALAVAVGLRYLVKPQPQKEEP